MNDSGAATALKARALSAGMSRREFMQATAAAGVSAALAGSMWSEVEAATPKKGGSLRVGVDGGASSDTLHPLQVVGGDHGMLAALSCYDTLVEIDGNGAPQPSLAESWEGSPDGTWAFKLRRGVEFHNGKTLTAADVVWSLKQHTREDSRFAEGKQIIGNLEELRADGPHTVIMKQREVNFDLPTHLSSIGLVTGQEGVEDWNAGVGTGPYALEAFEPGVRFAGRKFPNFYRDDQGHFDTVEVLNVTDPAARASGLLSRALDAIGSPDVNTARHLGGTDGFSLVNVSGTQHYTTDMRTDTPPFTDNNVRLAVKYGIKRQEIVDKVLGGFGTIGNDIPISRGTRFFNADLPQREYDPARAKFHLQQAGLDGIDLTFSTSDGAFAGAVDVGVLMKESMRRGPHGRHVHARGAVRRPARDRMDRRPALVQRIGGHVRQVLGRHRKPSGERRRPRGVEGRDCRMRHPRSLRGRHSPHGRLPADRQHRVGRHAAGHPGLAAVRPDRRAGLARAVGGPACASDVPAGTVGA